MVCNFFLGLLVQKLEIFKKTYRNRRKCTKIIENVPKSSKMYQNRRKCTKIGMFYVPKSVVVIGW